jgi:hypothetical protein
MYNAGSNHLLNGDQKVVAKQLSRHPKQPYAPRCQLFGCIRGQITTPLGTASRHHVASKMLMPPLAQLRLLLRLEDRCVPLTLLSPSSPSSSSSPSLSLMSLSESDSSSSSLSLRSHSSMYPWTSKDFLYCAWVRSRVIRSWCRTAPSFRDSGDGQAAGHVGRSRNPRPPSQANHNHVDSQGFGIRSS